MNEHSKFNFKQNFFRPSQTPGQLLEIANEIYGLDLKVRILESENDVAGGTAGPINLETGLKSVVVKYRLDFDNREYVMNLTVDSREVSNLINFFPQIITCCAPDEPQNFTQITIILQKFCRWRSNFTFKPIHHSWTWSRSPAKCSLSCFHSVRLKILVADPKFLNTK